MSSDDYQIKNISCYTRKSYKKGQRQTQDTEADSPTVHTIQVSEPSPRIEDRNEGHYSPPGCSCDADPESEIASILHKKCPVITLAQQQLQRLLDETELLCDNTRCCRSVYDFLCICKDIFKRQNKCRCALLALIVVAFVAGLIVGAATCGSYLGRFNSPILTCIENFFIPQYSSLREKFLSIT